jgi:hypothetical protein
MLVLAARGLREKGERKEQREHRGEGKRRRRKSDSERGRNKINERGSNGRDNVVINLRPNWRPPSLLWRMRSIYPRALLTLMNCKSLGPNELRYPGFRYLISVSKFFLMKHNYDFKKQSTRYCCQRFLLHLSSRSLEARSIA